MIILSGQWLCSRRGQPDIRPSIGVLRWARARHTHTVDSPAASELFVD